MIRQKYLNQYANQTIPRSNPMFRYVVEREMHESGGRVYLFITFEGILVQVKCADVSQRRLHEIIFPNQPCKLYMDCERNEADPEFCESASNVYAYAASMHDRVSAYLMEQYNYACSPPLIFTHCRKGKFSVHLVWCDVWFATPKHCCAVVKALKMDSFQGVSVDYHVYPVNTTPTMLRMPYCSKLGVDSYMRPLGMTDFVDDLFCRGLVGFSSESHPRCSRMTPFVPVKLTSGGELRRQHRVQKSELDMDTNMLDDAMEQTVTWLNLIYPSFHLKGRHVYEDGTGYQIIANMWCETAKRNHAANKTYIHTSGNGRMSAVCAHTECRKLYTLPFTVDDVVISEKPLNIDYTLLPTIRSEKRIKLVDDKKDNVRCQA